MIIAATSDVHMPRNYEAFVLALQKLTVRPDLFLLAGDMVHRGELQEYDKLFNAFFGKIFCPIVACFGNNEFQEIREKVKERYQNVKFLDDSSTVLEIGKKLVGIFGSTGSLETPTPWQKANIPNVENLFKARIMLAENQLQRMLVHFKILLLHYAPTYKTLEGESPRFYSSMGNIAFENVLLRQKPNLVVHGHSVRGTKQAWVDSVPVFNVSFPLNREIVVIDTEKLKPGLAKFV
jgi:Icc-related predicted phosphoesterase